jgi:hypothetical protein
MSQRQFGKMQRTIEQRFPACVRERTGRKTMIDFLADREKRSAELVLAQATRLRLRRAPQLLKKTQRKPGIGKACIESPCGSLLGRQGQRKVHGLG